jgi:hypothetical protein
MVAETSGLTVRVRVECPRCSARYDQSLYRRPRGLFLPPSRCGSCTAPWPRITEIRVEPVAGE